MLKIKTATSRKCERISKSYNWQKFKNNFLCSDQGGVVINVKTVIVLAKL
jgi:hypothetical protein